MPDDAGGTLRGRLATALDGAATGAGRPSPRPDASPERLVPAAVLVPVVAHPRGTTVLLTRRARHLASHAGQVSFPGGKIEPGDSSATDAALRETEEEIGLARDRVEVLGRLGERVTGSGFRVTPVVGLVRPPVPRTGTAAEVETVFEVPLDFVLDRANHRVETRLLKGVERVFHVLPYGEFYIWGLTARLLVALRDALEPS